MIGRHSEFQYEVDMLADYLRGSFVEDICSAMLESGLNKNQLAKKLHSSRQYVNKVLNESSNFTIKSIARIAVAFGRDAVIRMKKDTEIVSILPYDEWIRTEPILSLDEVKYTQTSSTPNVNRYLYNVGIFSQFLLPDVILPQAPSDEAFLIAEEPGRRTVIVKEEQLIA